MGERVERAYGDGLSAAVVGIVAWRCWGNDRKKPSTPGKAGCSAPDGVVRRRRCNTWPSAVEAGITGFDVVDGSGRIYVRSMVGEPGRGLSGVATMTRYWSPSSAGTGMVGGRAVLAARVVTVDMSGSGAVLVWGRAAECALMLRAASSRVADWRSTRTRPVPQGVGRADGRAVVIGCDEPLARGGGARHTIRADWLVQIGLAGGHVGMLRFAVGGLAGCEVVTGLSQAARNMVGRREMR